MPDLQQQQQQQNQGLIFDKKDPYRRWKLPIDGIAGLNTTQPPNAIQDNEVVSIFNYLPIQKTTVRKVASPQSICNLPTDAIKLVNDIINGQLIMFAILNDGSMGIIQSGTYTQMQPAGTFSTDPSLIDITNWQNTVFLIVDNAKGFFSFNGTSVVQVGVPSTPGLNDIPGGPLGASYYWVRITYVNSLGETLPSPEVQRFLAAKRLLVVNTPITKAGATGWNVYVSTTQGNETLQNSTPIAIGTNWTEPASGLVSGAALPTKNTTGGLSSPAKPSLSSTPGGTLAAATYYVQVTYVNSIGETQGSPEASFYVSANNLLVVPSPAANPNATGWNVYISTTTTLETLQNATPMAIGTNYTEPTTGIQTSGIHTPLFNTTGGFNLLSTSLNGKCICVWANRVFIGSGRILNYSAAGSYSDFNVLDGGGFFTLTFTDLKQEIIKLAPYMDSFYIIGDHAIIALTGTTISSDPTTWYQMELFNNSGTIYGCLFFVWNNMVFLINEFGIWMVAATQNQKLDYEFDLTQITIQNHQATITQVGNLNFYMIPVLAYDPVSGQNQNMLLCYCIELRKFYFLYFQFPILGVYATLSETDHSVYVWGNKQIYKLFVGGQNVTGYVQFKSFDLGNPYINKAVSYFMANIYVLSGIPSFLVNALSSPINSPLLASGTTQVISGVGGNFIIPSSLALNTVILTDENGNVLTDEKGNILTAKTYLPFACTFYNQYDQAMMCYSSGISGYITENVFRPTNGAVGGGDISFTIQETSSSIYDFINFMMEGYLGRMVR